MNRFPDSENEHSFEGNIGGIRREARDTFVSANCIIFNLYPVHAILDTVATPAQLVTSSFLCSLASGTWA